MITGPHEKSRKLRLLIVTQAIDRDDPFLGFFHRWVEEFATRCESIEVICLREGKHALPENVHVHSLGKSAAHGRQLTAKPIPSGLLAVSRKLPARIRYVFRFWRLIWTLRREYDAVFVHMNQEYVLLGGVFWKWQRKRVYLWRNHYAGSWFTDVAAAFCTKIFCTSKHSYTARYAKTKIMPVGVDTEMFRPDAAAVRAPRSILFLGRLSPSKNPDVLIEALGMLHARGVVFTATVCGSEVGNEVYANQIKARARELGLQHVVTFLPGVVHSATPALYASHEIFVNLSRSGMYDKTLFEAAASGCIVLATSDDFAMLTKVPPVAAGFQMLVDHLSEILILDDGERAQRSQSFISMAHPHSLPTLINTLTATIL